MDKDKPKVGIDMSGMTDVGRLQIALFLAAVANDEHCPIPELVPLYMRFLYEQWPQLLKEHGGVSVICVDEAGDLVKTSFDDKHTVTCE